MFAIQLFDIPLASFLGVLFLSLLKRDFASALFFHILRRHIDIPLAGTSGENRHSVTFNRFNTSILILTPQSIQSMLYLSDLT